MNEGKITIDGVEYDEAQLAALMEKDEAAKAYQRAYRVANQQKCKDLQKRWYENNKEYARAKQKERNAADRALLKLAKAKFLNNQ